MLCVVSGITGRPQYPPPAPKHTGRAQGPLRTATRCRLIKAQGRRFFRQQSSARATFSRGRKMSTDDSPEKLHEDGTVETPEWHRAPAAAGEIARPPTEAVYFDMIVASRT